MAWIVRGRSDDMRCHRRGQMLRSRTAPRSLHGYYPRLAMHTANNPKGDNSLPGHIRKAML